MSNQEMMATGDRIFQLDSLTASRIAAGEVVERPVSVVKELVENAIDAGARRIGINLETDTDAGCIAKIEISDDGCGMTKNDMVNAFRRHATSKIRSIEDLDSVLSLGFRGEALPSIASVSRVNVRSRAKGAEVGYQGENRGEQLVITGEIGMPEGTVISISDLFYQTPARRKFLKSLAVELGHVNTLIANMIISAPHIAFTLKVNGRNVLQSAGKGDAAQAILAVYGADTVSRLAAVNFDGTIKVRGYISLPPFSRSNRKYYHFYVNGRLVKSRELSFILEQAYDTLLPEKRYPFAVLYIDIAPEAIDVNVHPAKTEIRFHQLKYVKDELMQALSAALRGDLQVKIPEITAKPIVEPVTPKQPPVKPVVEFKAPQSEPKAAHKQNENSHWKVAESLMGVQDVAPVKPGIAAQIYKDIQAQEEARKKQLFSQTAAPVISPKTVSVVQSLADNKPEPVVLAAPKVEFITTKPVFEQAEIFEQKTENIFSVLRPLGQLGGSYIIATHEADLYIVDQHAAHERLLFERFAKEFEKNTGVADQLAVPLTCELGPLHQEFLFNHLEAVTDFGFVVEYLGDMSFVLRAVPLWYSRAQENTNLRRSDIFTMSTLDFFLAMLDKIIEQAEAGGGTIDISALNQEELFTAACKTAVKANAYLTTADINWLFAELAKAEKPQTCPHGRPTVIKVTDAEIRKRFLRT